MIFLSIYVWFVLPKKHVEYYWNKIPLSMLILMKLKKETALTNIVKRLMVFKVSGDRAKVEI